MINNFSSMTRYRINMQKIIYFIYYQQKYKELIVIPLPLLKNVSNRSIQGGEKPLKTLNL